MAVNTEMSSYFADNPYVKELYSILHSNGKNTDGLSALLNHVAAMESFVKHAEDRIADMKTQLDEIKEIQGHPLKSVLQNAIKTLERVVAKVKGRIAAMKADIIDGCKNAVTAFKESGISALDRLASFFNVKDGLLSIRQSLDFAIKIDANAISKIEAFSKEYHSAGRAFKNMARVLVGKEPLTKKKESGMLAKAVSAPYVAEKTILTAMRRSVNKAITGLENLQTKAWEKKAARTAATKKPSIAERLDYNRLKIEQSKREHRVQERVAVKGAEL